MMKNSFVAEVTFKLLFTFKKYILAKIKTEHPIKINKNLIYVSLKNLISLKTMMEQTVKSNSIKKFKVIVSIAHTLPIIRTNTYN